MGRLGLIAGSSLRGSALPQGEWELLQRHGEVAAYVPPHRIDHVANLRALAGAGCDRVLALGSVGGLRRELEPGTIVCPHDFVALDADPVTALEGPDVHRVPGFDAQWRERVLAASAEAGIEVVGEGVYWQARGPRLETRAEIALVAPDAHVIGMTVGTECVVAGELGLAYAALCVVDNYANGVAETELTLEQVLASRERNRAGVEAALAALLPLLAT
jgi:5'-methylthioadenosine phosphorylase